MDKCYFPTAYLLFLCFYLLQCCPSLLAQDTDFAETTCCECNTICKGVDHGILVSSKEFKDCKYTINNNALINTNHYSINWQENDQLVMFYPTLNSAYETWKAQGANGAGPSIQANMGDQNAVVDVSKAEMDTEYIIEYFTEESLQKNEKFIQNICSSSFYKRFYGSINISHVDHEQNYFLKKLANQDSTMFRHYEQEVKTYFDRMLSQTRLFEGFHNLIVSSFSPGLFVNFVLETIDQFNFTADNFSLIVKEESTILSSLPASGKVTVNSTTLQVNESFSEPCFSIRFSDTPRIGWAQSVFQREFSLAINDYCVFLRICPPGRDDNVQITQYKATLFNTKGGSVNFCVRSLLVERQVIESILNERYTIEVNFGEFFFNYLILDGAGATVYIGSESQKGGVTKNELVFIIIVIILVLLLVGAVLAAVWYLYQYTQSERTLLRLHSVERDRGVDEQMVQFRDKSQMHVTANRASEISLVIKTGPRETFYRPDSQISIDAATATSMKNKSLPDLSWKPKNYQKRTAVYTPKSKGAASVYTRSNANQENSNGQDEEPQDYDGLNYEYLQRTGTLPNNVSRSNQRISNHTNHTPSGTDNL